MSPNATPNYPLNRTSFSRSSLVSVPPTPLPFARPPVFCTVVGPPSSTVHFPCLQRCLPYHRLQILTVPSFLSGTRVGVRTPSVSSKSVFSPKSTSPSTFFLRLQSPDNKLRSSPGGVSRFVFLHGPSPSSCLVIAIFVGLSRTFLWSTQPGIRWSP